MNLNSIVMWGMWILGAGMVLVPLLLWCRGVNEKLDYLFEALAQKEREQHPGAQPGTSSSRGPTVVAKPLSPLVCVLIVVAAIFVFFIIPIWFLSRG